MSPIKGSNKSSYNDHPDNRSQINKEMLDPPNL